MDLVTKYKKNTPSKLRPLWDLSLDRFKKDNQDNLRDDIINGKLKLFEIDKEDFWNGVFKPDYIYSKETLWNRETHDSNKIANVIKLWEEEKTVPPIFLVKHASLDKALISDGNHRFTVANYFDCEKLFFIVEEDINNWYYNAFDNLKEVDFE